MPLSSSSYIDANTRCSFLCPPTVAFTFCYLTDLTLDDGLLYQKKGKIDSNNRMYYGIALYLLQSRQYLA